jgi:hypothetical protein
MKRLGLLLAILALVATAALSASPLRPGPFDRSRGTPRPCVYTESGCFFVA